MDANKIETLSALQFKAIISHQQSNIDKTIRPVIMAITTTIEARVRNASFCLDQKDFNKMLTALGYYYEDEETERPLWIQIIDIHSDAHIDIQRSSFL